MKLDLTASELHELVQAPQEKILELQKDLKEGLRQHNEMCNSYYELKDKFYQTAKELEKLQQQVPSDHFSVRHVETVRDLISATLKGEKIRAIKAVKTLTHQGLKDCKDLVEEFPSLATYKSAQEPIHEGTVRELISCAVADQKIGMIKEVRRILGLGLKEAKDLVEDSCAAGWQRRVVGGNPFASAPISPTFQPPYTYQDPDDRGQTIGDLIKAKLGSAPSLEDARAAANGPDDSDF